MNRIGRTYVLKRGARYARSSRRLHDRAVLRIWCAIQMYWWPLSSWNILSCMKRSRQRWSRFKSCVYGWMCCWKEQREEGEEARMELPADDLVAAYAALFVGCPDAYAVQQADGAYWRVCERVTLPLLAAHLAGRWTLAVTCSKLTV